MNAAKIKDDVLYLGDNGRCYCGEHLGTTAKMTGRDISGQAIMPVTPEVAEESRRMSEKMGHPISLQCEDARCERTPSSLYLP